MSGIRIKQYSLLNWLLGNIICSLGVALSTKADFGLSMIGACPYIIHVWLRDSFAWFTQGTAEYFVEAAVLIAACVIIRRFRLSYLLNFLEALVIGAAIDIWFGLMGGNMPFEALNIRIAAFVLSILITALGVAFFFRTDMPLQTYDFAVIKIAERYGIAEKKVKFCNDITMLAVDIALALGLTGRLTGIGIATFISALVNSAVINMWGSLIDRVQKRPEKS